MRKLFYSLSGVEFVSLLIVGFSALNSYAAGECLDPKSPLRGSWSYSQVEEIVPLFDNLPITSVGVLKIDDCGRFRARAVGNVPCQDVNCFGLAPLGVKNPLEFTFEGRIITQPDGMATATGIAFGAEFRRVCAVMEKRGGCFQEFRCVSTDPAPPNAVLLATFKRQSQGTCQ